jgi:hypothetical protein
MLNHTRHARLPAATIALVCTSVVARAQLMSNGSIDSTTPALALVNATGNNTPAPGGSQWSEVASTGVLLANTLAGAACNADPTDASAGLRLADDFIVPEGQVWNLADAQLFAYQSGVSRLTATTGSIRIWNGQPGAAASSVVFGDTTTNRVTSVEAMNAYRVFTTTVGPAIMSPDTSRRLHVVTLSANATLNAGTYWIDFQLARSESTAPIFVVPVTLQGVRSLAQWNAQQYADGAWSSLVDTGKPDGTSDAPQDIAFTLTGSVGPSCDSVDFNRNGVFPENDDILDFFNVLAGGACPYPDPCDLDINNNGVFPENDDILDFFNLLAGGTC